MDFSKKKFLLLAAATLFGFGAAGIGIIHYFQNNELSSILSGEKSILVQALSGLIYGVLVAVIALVIVKQPFMKKINGNFRKLIGQLKLSWMDIILVSFCAGVGEELFFRGGLQPLIGIWLTSVIFVALHGYINPRNWQISIYGLFMIFAIAGLGYIMVYIGLPASMLAHAIIDVILLAYLSGKIAP